MASSFKQGPEIKKSDSPLIRLWELLEPESRDMWGIVFYGVLISALSLTVPIAVQALVNSVGYGQLTQQLLVLSLFVLMVMLFSGTFSAIQYYYVELLQRRLFARYALDLSLRIPRLAAHGLRERFGAELVNPFLEVAVLHKSLAHILLGGLGLILQVIVGVVLLAVYHPLLLGFALGLIAVITLIFTWGGRGGITSADNECSAKYAMLNWLEDMARMPIMFHSAQGESFGLHRADEAVKQWLDARRAHFRVLFRQNISMFATQAIASSLLLGLGGVLVIRGQLSLGQLVAAELVLNAALSGLEKLGKHLESFYDLMAALRKLDKLREMPLESEGDEAIPDDSESAAELDIRDLTVTFRDTDEHLFSNIQLHLAPRDLACIYGAGSSGKTFLLDCIYGLVSEYQGQIRLDGFDLQDITRRSLRSRIGLVGEPEFFHGTLEDNLKVGAPGVTKRELRHVLDLIGLEKTIARLPEGLQSVMTPQSGVFSRGELIRFSIVRTLLWKPGLILLDQSLDALDDEGLQNALSLLFAEERTWTVLAVTNSRELAIHFPRAWELRSGKLLEIPAHSPPLPLRKVLNVRDSYVSD